MRRALPAAACSVDWSEARAASKSSMDEEASANRLDRALPRLIQGAVRDLSLAGKNLPEPDFGLKATEGIGAQSGVLDLGDLIGAH